MSPRDEGSRQELLERIDDLEHRNEQLERELAHTIQERNLLESAVNKLAHISRMNGPLTIIDNALRSLKHLRQGRLQ